MNARGDQIKVAYTPSIAARVGKFADRVLRGPGNSVLLDPEFFLELFWAAGTADKSESLAIKTLVVGTNYLNRSEMVYRSGPLKPAVAGSIAILFRPVEYHGCVLIDGGAMNPLPYVLLFDLHGHRRGGGCDIRGTTAPAPHAVGQLLRGTVESKEELKYALHTRMKTLRAA